MLARAIIFVGITNLVDPETPGLLAKKIVVHPKFNADSLKNDIALLFLASNSTAKPATLSSSSIAVGKGNGVITGFGATVDTEFSKRLQKTTVSVQQKTYCANYLGRLFFADTSVCLGSYGSWPIGFTSTPCTGDSGGPLLNQHGHLSGTSSFTINAAGKNNCGRFSASVYIDVSKFIPWIKSYRSSVKIGK